LAERPVGPVRVVVFDVLGEDCFEVTPSEDEHPVEALAPDGADHALADGVRPRLSGQSRVKCPCRSGMWARDARRRSA